MIPRRACSACAVLGLVACLHALDTDHVAHFDTDPIMMTAGLPTQHSGHDHTHEEFDRTVRIPFDGFTVSGTSSGPSVLTNDPSDLLFRVWDQRRKQFHNYFGSTFASGVMWQPTTRSTSSSTR